MKSIIVLATFVISAFAVTTEDYCYKDAIRTCTTTAKNHDYPVVVQGHTAANREDLNKIWVFTFYESQDINGLSNCNALYGAMEAVLPDLQAYVNTHITRSYEYLLMSTHYGNYEKSREGFEKLYQDLSNDKWHEAIDLIKYITKRGGKMDFSVIKQDTINDDSVGKYEFYELESVAKALDMEKQLAVEAHRIHGEATRRRKDYHDPEVSSFLEEEFVHKHASIIRKLSGYAADLYGLLDGPDSSLGLYLFDGFLKKESIV